MSATPSNESDIGPACGSRGVRTAPRREIVLFRNNLFRWSEPFIAQQGQQLQRFKPCYFGRLRFGAAPAGAESFALQDGGKLSAWPRVAWQMLTRSPACFQKQLENRRPALIHAHFGIDGVYALALAQRLRVPLVTTFHGFDAAMTTGFFFCSPAWINYPLFRRRLARRGDLFLCVSSFIRDRVLAMGFPEHRTHLHYVGIDVAAVRVRDPAEETPIILHVARLVEMKGTAYLIRAFARLARLYPDVELVIIGGGWLERRLRALVCSLGLDARVRFAGVLSHDAVMRWTRRAAMLVLPSVRTATGRTEGLGMVLLEAAATGVPAIGTRQGGIPEVIIHGETGWLVPERDVERLAERMGQLLADTPMRRRMGARARQRVLQYFDIRRQTEKLERFYDQVLTDAR